MKSKSINDGAERIFVLVLAQGEEAFKTITEFADKRRVGVGDRRFLASPPWLV